MTAPRPPAPDRLAPPAPEPGRADGHLVAAVDATALLGHPTGVGVFCAGILGGLAGRPALTVRAFAVSWRRRHGIESLVPPGVAVHQRAMPARPLHLAWRRLGRPPVEWFTGPADVVHGTNFVVPPTRRAGRVVTVHDLTVVRYPELGGPGTDAFPVLIRRALGEGAFVHTPSAAVAGEVVELLGADPARVRAVHSGVTPLPPPAPSDAAAVARHVPDVRARLIVSVGTAEPRKDLPGLVRAFGRLAGDRPDVFLVLAGPPGWGDQALDEAVAESAFAGRIVRTGWVDDATRAALVRRAEVLAYPSRYEGFGFPPLEAMSAGTPVVATRAGALPEVLGDAALLVPPADPDALADALARVLDDPDLAASLAARGAAHAAGFTWARAAAGLEDLYREVVAGAA